MISKAVEQINAVFHNSCKKDLEKSERKLEDLDSVIKNLAFENHQLKAIYDYRVFELEEQIKELTQAVIENEGSKVDTLIDQDLIEQTQEKPKIERKNLLQMIIRK